MRQLRHLRASPHVELKQLVGSLSGAQVLVAKPFSGDGRELPSSVLKYDKQEIVEKEAGLMEEHGKAWGATYLVFTFFSTRGDSKSASTRARVPAKRPQVPARAGLGC